MEKIKNFVKEMVGETKRMRWPTKEDITKKTGNSIFLMISSAAFIYALDQLAQMGLRSVLTLFG